MKDIKEQIKNAKIVLRDIDELIPYAKNSRKHSPSQIDKIAKSIQEFGFTNAVLIKPSGDIIAGHCRVLAAKKLKLKEVPCIELNLTDEQAKAYVIADNQLALISEWDEDILKSEALELQDNGFDLDILGFDDGYFDFDEKSSQQGNIDADEVPEVAKNVHNVKRGQIWKLGEHRLMCGDSIDEVEVGILMAGQKVDMVFTDPPYGVKVVKGGKVGADFGVAKKGQYAEIIGDETTDAAHAAISICQSLKIQVQIYWGGNYYADKLPPSSCWLVWDKRVDSGIENTFADCELAWTNMTGPARVHKQLWNGMIRQGEKEKRVHPTQKPIALAEWAITKFSKGDKILDLFGGSGSTLIACEKTKRKCFMMELDEHYCSVIIERWQQFTGQKAELIQP